MRAKLRLISACVFCVLLTAPRVNAWNSIGHMSVAYVAYQKLTPEQRTRVAALLALNPNYKKWIGYIRKPDPANQDLYIFMMAATWPDQIKAMGSPYKQDGDFAPKTAEATNNTGYGDMYRHQYWHFVDLPFTMDGTSPLPAVPTPNAETEIAVFEAALSDPSVPDAVKSYDLVWLMHLVGDVHEPLHCVNRISHDKPRGDGGGNSIPLPAPPVNNNLHEYWDSLLGTGSTSDFLVAANVASALPAADATASSDLTTDDWVQESFALAPTAVYVDPPIAPGIAQDKIDPNSSYAKNALAVVQHRVALAGARLAGVLAADLK